jgi:glycosyltransferase involved in cell wall biosynthesis
MPGPGVSVVIPTYNRAHLVPRAIRSVLAALEADDEIVIADDASTDDTAAALAPFGDRVRHLKLPHGGAGAARNHGIRAATRPLVAFLDSDDEWHPHKIRLQRDFLAARPDVLWCFSNFCVRTDNGETLHNFIAQWHRDSRSWDAILGPGMPYSAVAALPAAHDDFRVHVGSVYLAEMESDYVATSTVMVRREEAGAALHFAEDLPVSEDKECFARLAGQGQTAYFDCELATQWGHGGPRLTDANIYALASARLALLDRVWAQDATFMAAHRERLAECRRAQHLKRAQWLMVRGRTREARGDLRQAGACPLSFRLLAALPGPLTRGLLRMRRLVRGEA